MLFHFVPTNVHVAYRVQFVMGCIWQHDLPTKHSPAIFYKTLVSSPMLDPCSPRQNVPVNRFLSLFTIR